MEFQQGKEHTLIVSLFVTEWSYDIVYYNKNWKRGEESDNHLENGTRVQRATDKCIKFRGKEENKPAFQRNRLIIDERERERKGENTRCFRLIYLFFLISN